MTDIEEVETLLQRLRYDLTAAQGKISEIKNALARGDVEPRKKVLCPQCRLELTELRLPDHLKNVHDLRGGVSR